MKISFGFMIILASSSLLLKIIHCRLFNQIQVKCSVEPLATNLVGDGKSLTECILICTRQGKKSISKLEVGSETGLCYCEDIERTTTQCAKKDDDAVGDDGDGKEDDSFVLVEPKLRK